MRPARSQSIVAVRLPQHLNREVVIAMARFAPPRAQRRFPAARRALTTDAWVMASLGATACWTRSETAFLRGEDVASTSPALR
jgi:hypothetical protein